MIFLLSVEIQKYVFIDNRKHLSIPRFIGTPDFTRININEMVFLGSRQSPNIRILGPPV